MTPTTARTFMLAVSVLASSAASRADELRSAGKPARLDVRVAGQHSIRSTLMPARAQTEFPVAFATARRTKLSTKAVAQKKLPQPVYKRSVKENETKPAEELRVQPIGEQLRKEYRLDSFYKKAVVIDGIPITGSENVSDYAFLECAWIVDHMLAGQDRIKQALVENKVRIGIIAATEYTMDIPENQRPRMLARAAYHDRRSRGLGGVTMATCGEENLLSLRGDPYRLENITIHEFAHTIASNLRRVDRAWWDRLNELYRRAMDEKLWANSYAATNVQEYWAEGTQSWFDCNTPRDDRRVHNGVWNREKLQQYDPRLAEFLEETFGNRPWRYAKTTNRPPAEREHLQGLDRDKLPVFSFENSPRIQAERRLNQRRPDNDSSQPPGKSFEVNIRVNATSDAGRRLAVESTHGHTLDEIMGRRGERRRRSARQPDVVIEPDVHALAALDGNKLTAMVWQNYADDLPGAAAAVELTFAGLPHESGTAGLQHYRIDDEHSNAYTAWLRMDSPQEPSREQYAELEKAAKLAQLDAPKTAAIENGQATIRFQLPRQGVSLVVLQLRAMGE